MNNTQTGKNNIIPHVDYTLPRGMALVIRPNKSISFLDPFIDMIDLSYTLKQKLLFIAQYVHKNKIVFEDCLSSGDKQIVENILNDSTTKRMSLWENLLNKNKITYQDGLFTNLNNDLETLKRHDRCTYEYFYKWVNLEQHGQSKINTIISNKIYIPSPLDFNDRFDCQMHLSSESLSEIAEANTQNEAYVRFIELLINYMPRVCSFSLVNPIDLEANIMWGLYGNCSIGFAVSYKILDIIELLMKSHFNVNNESHTLSTRDNIDVINFKKVIYYELNTFAVFKTAIHKYFISKSQRGLQEFITNDFLLNKSVCWKHEKEFRLFKVLNLMPYINHILHKPVNNSTCEEIDSVLKEMMDKERESESRYEKFIAPNKIILGWKCDLKNEDIIRLLNYARSKTIKVIKLTGKIHYQCKEFESIDLDSN